MRQYMVCQEVAKVKRKTQQLDYLLRENHTLKLSCPVKTESGFHKLADRGRKASNLFQVDFGAFKKTSR